MFDFTFSFLYQLALLSVRAQADPACRQRGNFCSAHTKLFTLFVIIYLFIFCFLILLCGAVPSLSVQPGFARGAPHDQSLFGQKIHIATSNKNNSSLLMRQPQGHGTTHTHTHRRTHAREWRQSEATAPLRIPHSGLMSTLRSRQQGTCVHSWNNKFGNPDPHWGRV